MFEDALLESSPRRASVLRRIHYLLSIVAGTLFFAQGLYLLPLLLLFADRRALFVTSAMWGVAASSYRADALLRGRGRPAARPACVAVARHHAPA